MPFDQQAFNEHIARVQASWDAILTDHDFDAAVVPAGRPSVYFEDDQSPPFHPNPHFARFVPESNCAQSVLVLRPGQSPKLLFYSPEDFWHAPPQVPDWAPGAFDLQTFGNLESLTDALTKSVSDASRVALVGPSEPLGNVLPSAEVNPVALVNALHYDRAAKTPFELDRMREASARGVAGHVAAREAFFGGGSEFDIHLAYLRASEQTETELPYQNIIALNEHAGLLHYQHYERKRPADTRSFLIDAGAQSHGYHSDITRTYSIDPDDDFAQLIEALDVEQRALIDTIELDMPYVDLHTDMHQRIADLLVRFDFLRCSAEAAFEQRITDAFFPHGLGHLLGLQTHDVGGHFANAQGDPAPPPARFPSLRLTRTIEPGHVFTIEPGIYFIPMLLDGIEAQDDVNWQRVEEFLPCGGIRIEDNVAVHDRVEKHDEVENLTRPCFEQNPGAAS